MLLRFIAWTGQLGRLFLLPVSHHILCRSFEAISLLSPFYMDFLVFRCSLPFAHEGAFKMRVAVEARAGELEDAVREVAQAEDGIASSI